MALAPIDFSDKFEHKRTQELLKLKPELCTSHTVLVVDNSGSMMEHDIILHRDRQVAAYSVTAMEFTADQLLKQTATNSDIVSLIEFDKTARVVFSKEAFSWVLYNALLNRRDSRNFESRRYDTAKDILSGDLMAAAKILGSIDHDRCALSLLFLSDGAPTDANTQGLIPLAAKFLMAQKIKQIAQKYEEKLNIQMIGFGSEYHDFSVLEDLVEAATLADSGTKANFTYCGKVADKVASAVNSRVSSTTLTRSELLQSDRGKSRTKRKVQMESEVIGKVKWNLQNN